MMVNYHCVAERCTNDSRKKNNTKKYPEMVLNGKLVNFHPLPSMKANPKLRKIWLRQIKRDGFEPDPKVHWHALCSRHFIDGEPTKVNPIPTLFAYNNYKIPNMQRTTKNSEVLRPSALQQPLLPIAEYSITVTTARRQQKRQSLSVGENAQSTPKPYEDHNYSHVNSQGDHSVEELSAYMIEDHRKLKEKCHQYEGEIVTLRDQVASLSQELEAVRAENRKLHAQLQNKDELYTDVLVDRVTKNDTNVNSFLGLPSVAMLFGIFQILASSAATMKYWSGKESAKSKKWQNNAQKKPGLARKLSQFQEFILSLLRLRLGLNTYFLSLLFGVSQSSVSKIFTSWISLMTNVLGPLLKWPSKEKVKKHMPLAFRTKYPDTRVIIDATEFYVQRPRNPTVQSKTWSNYKSKNTFKLLVGITPNGAFSFVSELWSGNISDRCITQKSGFLDLIEEGDHVMADRGFLIQDLLLAKGACLNIPPFTRACKHGKGRCLTNKETRESKSIASLRIHVERAIQRLKSFKYLSGTMNINSLSVANQAVLVSAVFCNFMKPLVKKTGK